MIVLGPVNPEELGLVLPHEHLFIDFQKTTQPLPNEAIKDVNSLALSNLGNIRQYP